MRLSRGDCRVSWVWDSCHQVQECKSVTTAPGRRGRAPRAGVDCLVFSTVSSRWHAMLDARWVLDTRAIAPARDTGDCEAAEHGNSATVGVAPSANGTSMGTSEPPLKNRGLTAAMRPTATRPAVRRKDPRQPPPPAARCRRPRCARLDHSTRRKGLLITALVTPHPRAITCAREPNRPALVDSATISRSRAPAPVQNVTSTSRVPARRANGKTRANRYDAPSSPRGA